MKYDDVYCCTLLIIGKELEILELIYEHILLQKKEAHGKDFPHNWIWYVYLSVRKKS